VYNLGRCPTFLSCHGPLYLQVRLPINIVKIFVVESEGTLTRSSCPLFARRFEQSNALIWSNQPTLPIVQAVDSAVLLSGSLDFFPGSLILAWFPAFNVRAWARFGWFWLLAWQSPLRHRLLWLCKEQESAKPCPSASMNGRLLTYILTHKPFSQFIHHQWCNCLNLKENLKFNFWVLCKTSNTIICKEILA
jgi:hypothetical protein